MNEKEIKKEAKLLAKQKKFEEIYQQYGPKYFRKYVSRKFKKEDIKKLANEGKYLAVYERYGEKELDYLSIYYKDIENEAGRKRSLPMKTLYMCKRGLKAVIKDFAIAATLVGTLAGTALLALGRKTDIAKLENSKKYAKEIDEYANKIKEYSKKFDIHTQSDMEIIMRTMKDMHETIRGYGKPEVDAIGYRGMDVMDEDGIGVCRNMAENIADKLNEINPEYNARTFCFCVKFGDWENAKIAMNIIEGNERTNIKGNTQRIYIDGKLKTYMVNKEDCYIQKDYDKGKITRKIIADAESERTTWYGEKGESTMSIIENGYETTIRYDKLGKEIGRKKKKTDRTNMFLKSKKTEEKEEQNDSKQESLGDYHRIVAVDLKDDNITLLIDPTNPGLGIYKNGKIHMFNEKRSNEAIYDKDVV